MVHSNIIPKYSICLQIFTGHQWDTVTYKDLKVLVYKGCLLEELLQLLDGEFHNLVLLLIKAIMSKRWKLIALIIGCVAVIVNTAISCPQVCGHCNAVHVLQADHIP